MTKKKAGNFAESTTEHKSSSVGLWASRIIFGVYIVAYSVFDAVSTYLFTSKPEPTLKGNEDEKLCGFPPDDGKSRHFWLRRLHCFDCSGHLMLFLGNVPLARIINADSQAKMLQTVEDWIVEYKIPSAEAEAMKATFFASLLSKESNSSRKNNQQYLS